MSHSPTISVVMPVYNAEKYLNSAIESILSQSFGDFEFLITDDGSTDSSLALLKHYATKDSRIRLSSRSNRGVVATLNEMSAQAMGAYIARMDADDIAYPERFAQQVALLQREADVVCVGGAYEMVSESGHFVLKVDSPQRDWEIQQHLLSGSTAIQHPCAMLRRKTLHEVGGYDEKAFLAEDLDLWLRMGEVGQLANLRDTVLQYRVHAQSISGRKLRRQSQVIHDVCQRAWNRRGIQGTCENIELRNHNLMMQCGWATFNQGQRQQSLAYGLQAVKILPFHKAGWKLLLAAALKPMPKQDVL